MATTPGHSFSGLAVWNPGGRDAWQDYAAGPGHPEDGLRGVHAPVNYHAYAACTRGAFHREFRTIPPGAPVLVLLRRDLGPALRALRVLRREGHRVVVSWKESGLFQVAHQLERRGAREVFGEICAQADGALSSTPDLVPLYRAAGARRVHFLPTPYPVDFPAWDFSHGGNEKQSRKGIFLGTREFGVPSRQHALALEIALETAVRHETFVTLMQAESPPWAWRARLRAAETDGLLRRVPAPLPYPHYARLMSGHAVVFQLDRSAVPGQVAGDALLGRVLVVGGDGATERLAYPSTCGHGRDAQALQEALEQALASTETRWTEEEAAQSRAAEVLSFAAVEKRLRAWLWDEA